MGISLVRLLILSLGLILAALALSFNLGGAIDSFYSFTHDILTYPGFGGFPL